jgi:hypothetical protein
MKPARGRAGQKSRKERNYRAWETRMWGFREYQLKTQERKWSSKKSRMHALGEMWSSCGTFDKISHVVGRATSKHNNRRDAQLVLAWKPTIYQQFETDLACEQGYTVKNKTPATLQDLENEGCGLCDYCARPATSAGPAADARPCDHCQRLFHGECAGKAEGTPPPAAPLPWECKDCSHCRGSPAARARIMQECAYYRVEWGDSVETYTQTDMALEPLATLIKCGSSATRT